MKRYISVLAMLIILLSVSGLTAYAAGSEADALGEVHIYSGGTEKNYLTVNGSIRSMLYTYYMYDNGEGTKKEIPAYCVNPTEYGVPQTVSPGESIEYLADAKASDPKVVGIITYGYPHYSLEQLGLADKYEAYYATKIALWCYLIPEWNIHSAAVNPNLTGADRIAAERVLAAAKHIYTWGSYWTTMYNEGLSITFDRETAYPVTAGGTQYYQQTVTVKSNTWVKNARINVSFAHPNEVPAGSKIVDLNNNETDYISTAGDGYSGQFKVLYPASSLSGSGNAQFSLFAEVDKYAVFYAICAETDKYGKLQNYLLDTDPTMNMHLSGVSRYNTGETAEDTPTTGLEIIKYEAGNTKTLEGALFEVKGPAGDVIGTYSTNAAGRVILDLTESGTYIVTELTPPNYYLLSESPARTVTVNYGKVSTVSFENRPFGELRVEKKDSANGSGLEGAVIQIKHIESGAVESGPTGTGGSYNFTNLLPGAYEILESVSPEGYISDGRAHTVNVTAGETVSYTLKNEAKPGLRIIKYDAQALTRMPDVVFEIYKDASLFGEYVTNQLGEIVLHGLLPGTYLVKEVAADNSHVVTGTPQQIEIVSGQGMAELVFLNQQKPGMSIIKLDSETLEPLPNAGFLINMVGGSFSREFVTDENGEIDLAGLEPAAYSVKERFAPASHLIDNGTRIIRLNPDEQATFVFTDTKKPSLVIVKRAADTGELLPDVSFRISKIGDESHYIDRTTDENGTIKIDNQEPGIYAVREIGISPEYIINEDIYNVELFPGKTSELIVSNDRKPNLRIVKIDALTGERLSGAVFTLNEVDGATLTTAATAENGEILIDNLNPGVYEIKEKTSPKGYLLQEETQLITLFPNQTGTAYFENYKKPTLTIKKIDSVTGDPIKGAEFEILRASDNTFTGELNLLGVFQSDAAGEIVLNDIQSGWYRIKESAPAAGYAVQSPDTQSIYVEAGTGKTVIFENTPLSALVIRKVSAAGETLSGAKFQLRYLGGTSGTGGTVIGTYTTSSNGTIAVTGLKAGTYVLEELQAPDGYTITEAAKTIYISGDEQAVINVEVINNRLGELVIKKTDATDPSKHLPDAVFKVTDSSGAYIGNANGEYITDKDGLINISGIEPDTTVKVVEIKAPSGYTVDPAPQTIKIQANKVNTLTFENMPVKGLQIQKFDEDTGKPISGVEFSVSFMNGEFIGKYTTDENGMIFLPELLPDWYEIIEVREKTGYMRDPEPRRIELTEGKTAVLTVTNKKAAGLLLQKIDSVTKEGVYGVEFLLSDAGNNPIGQYITDQGGYINIPDLESGKYYLRELRADGYILDDRVKTVYIESGKTSEIKWENTPVTGQIQVYKYSLEHNEVTGIPAGSTLEGAVFEIIKAKSGAPVCYITSDVRGVAASPPLPLDRYFIKEVTAPAYYKLSNEKYEADLEFPGQIIKISAFNESASLGVAIKKVGNIEIIAGDTMRYDFPDISNTSNVSLSDFYWHDRIPTDAVRAVMLTTGTYNKRLNYRVLYKTTFNDYRVLADNLLTTNNYSFNLTSAVSGTSGGETVTDIRFEFGNAPSGFAAEVKPTLTVITLPALPNGYQIVNRAEIGGKSQGVPQTAVSSWVTKVVRYNSSPTLPKTGY